MQAIRPVFSNILVFGFAVGCGESPDVSVSQPQRSALTAAHPNRHVLLISLDGFHDIDLARCVEAHPRCLYPGVTTGPSDSYPGSLAMMTGGTPVSTGVLYDNSWDRSLSPQGSNRSTLGANALYDENADVIINDLNTTVDPNSVPRDPRNGCTPVMPHQYIKTNTVFEVIKVAGLRTAYSDKHPSYDIYNGPSGQGVDDLFTPEADANGQANSVAATEGNGELKVQSVINEIDGFDHRRRARALRGRAIEAAPEEVPAQDRRRRATRGQPGPPRGGRLWVLARQPPELRKLSSRCGPHSHRRPMQARRRAGTPSPSAATT